MNKKITIIILIIFINLSLFSIEPINIQEVLKGEYIGNYIEYASEGQLLKIITKEWNENQDLIKKIESGKFHSDKSLKVHIDYSVNGYSVSLKSKIENTAGIFTWGINDFLKNENLLEFTRAGKDVFSLNFNPHAYWLKFKIENKSNNNIKIFLELDKNLYSWLDLFISEDNGYTVKRGAFETPLNKRELYYKNLLFKINVKPGLHTYYIRTDGNFVETLPLRIWNEIHLIKKIGIDNVIQGIITGIFLLLIIYSIFLFFSVKNKSYLYLLLISLSALFLYYCNSGFGYQYIWQNNPRFGAFLFFTLFPVSFIFNILFCKSFIDTKKNTPVINTILSGIIIASFIILLLTIIVPGRIRFFVFYISMIIEHIHLLPVIVSTVIVIKRRNYYGIYLLIGILLHIASQVEFFLSSADIIPYNLINYLNIRSIAYVLMMTFGLSDKLITMKKSLSKLKEKIFEINLKIKTKKNITGESILKIEIVKKYIIENYSNNITRDSLSYAVGLSPDHLGRIFKQHTGEKLSDFMNKIRINQAVKLLKKTDKKIIDIAFDTGFESLRTFNKIFQNIIHTTPTNFRKNIE